MKINELYDTYKDRPVKRIDAETKDNILASLSSINSINDFNEAEKFIKVLALCRGAQAAMDGEKRNNTLRTLLSTGEEGAYVDNDSYINERFMYELIQNVDDCKYASPDDCKLAINFDVDKDKITESTSFTDDLDADSIDLVEFILQLEDEFGSEIPDEEAEKIKTVGDAVSYIESHQG